MGATRLVPGVARRRPLRGAQIGYFFYKLPFRYIVLRTGANKKMTQTFDGNLPAQHMVGPLGHARAEPSGLSSYRQQNGRMLRLAVAILSFAI